MPFQWKPLNSVLEEACNNLTPSSSSHLSYSPGNLSFVTPIAACGIMEMFDTGLMSFLNCDTVDLKGMGSGVNKRVESMANC